jgi:hypothetical protein
MNANAPKWLEELRQEQAAPPAGAIAHLREVARTRQAQSIGGLTVVPPVAELMLAPYDRLTPEEQELFAAECNGNFRACAGVCIAAEAAGALARMYPHALAGGESLRRAIEEFLATGKGEVTIMVVDEGPGEGNE